MYDFSRLRTALIVTLVGQGANLGGVDLGGVDLRNAYLSQANLSGANLNGADLHGADLHGANLRWADLCDVDLSGADLRGADLSGADLHRANLSGTNFHGAELSGANLSGANLSGANLRGANLLWAALSRADLRGADLSGADLHRANLFGTAIENATLPPLRVNLPEGDITVYKKLKGGVIATLVVPAEAKRTATLVGNKCRAEFARVIDLGGKTGAVAKHDGSRYRLNEIYRPDSYDDDIRLECTNGVHFFLTREEAEAY